MMLNYIYDGSFEGLLTSIFEAYYRREKPDGIIPSSNIQASILSRNVIIETDTSKASRVYNSIIHKISKEALENSYYTYLSELENSGIWIYNYLSLGWKVGADVNLYLSDDRVLKVHGASRKVLGERHRMLGLLRFRQVKGGIYYAPMEPLYNISALLAPHFAERLSDQMWVIHDLGRRIAVVYNTKVWAVANVGRDIDEILEDGEDSFQNLWKQYFKNIAVQGRINPKLQMQHMPKRYWDHLTEKKLN
jgi:probable DNA metabolism protein